MLNCSKLNTFTPMKIGLICMYCQVEVYAAAATFSLHMHPLPSSLAIEKVGLELEKNLSSGYLSL